MNELNKIGGHCICPVCGYVSKFTDCDKVHIDCVKCLNRPDCLHSRGPTGRYAPACSKCPTSVPIFQCELFGDITATVEVPMTQCCRLCGPNDGYSPVVQEHTL